MSSRSTAGGILDEEIDDDWFPSSKLASNAVDGACGLTAGW